MKIRAAHKDYSARGSRREHWYRMVWIDGTWQYFAERKLASANYLASDRHDTAKGDVEPGDLICQHDHGGKVDLMYVVTDSEDVLVRLPFSRRGGELRVSFPFEEKPRILPDPRR